MVCNDVNIGNRGNDNESSPIEVVTVNNDDSDAESFIAGWLKSSNIFF